MLPIEIYSGFFNPRHACKWGGGDYKGCVSHRYNEGESVRGAHGSRDFSKSQPSSLMGQTIREVVLQEVKIQVH